MPLGDCRQKGSVASDAIEYQSALGDIFFSVTRVFRIYEALRSPIMMGLTGKKSSIN